MAWYTRKEIAELEREVRGDLGSLFWRYSQVVQTKEALDEIQEANIISDENIKRVLINVGLSDVHELEEYHYFYPALATYLQDKNRLTLANENGWKARLLETNSDFNFKILGLYPQQIKQMVRYANRCESLFKKFYKARHSNQTLVRVYTVDTESKDFPQIVSGPGYRNYPFIIGPGSWTPLENMLETK